MTNAVRSSSRGEADAYRAFLEAKVRFAETAGFDVAESEVNPILKDHQRALVRWAVAGGRRAVFAAFGLGKSVMQLEQVRLVRERAAAERLSRGSCEPAMGLIVAPLGVRQEFMRDAAMLGITLRFVRGPEEMVDPEGLYLTNYETVRDGRLDPGLFAVASLDEASALRGMGGTKTFREFMRLFERVPYRFVATATPSPNEYIELLAYAAFLGVMDIGEAKTRFFRRDSEHADKLTLHPHKEKEFWLWVASWAIFLQKPSDLGFSDEGYDLPAMKVVYHEAPVDHGTAGTEKDGQGRLFRSDAIGVAGAARAKRDTLAARVKIMVELLRADPDSRYIIWHDLEAEREAIEQALPNVVSVYGSQDLDAREQAIVLFSDGWFPYLAAKPVIAGSGCNFQRHCHKAVFLGIGFKFNDFIQAIHRIQRFLQVHPVEIHVIHAESEREVLRTLKKKWVQHEEMVKKMTAIIREYGLSNLEMAQSLTRSMGVERVEVSDARGDAQGRQRYRLVNNDCVVELRDHWADDSVDLVVTSIPFSTQYEYTPSYNDFGHTDDNEHFWKQIRFLLPHLHRVVKPGRDLCIHVKDRIVPGGMTGLGFQTVYPFADDCVREFIAGGFAFLGRVTNVTDVVRENNQTYRLGWSEQCKDGTRMGAGLPEYILHFRKPPSDLSNGYADTPVEKDKSEYSRARWQLDAAGYWRSSGDRLMSGAELAALPSDQVWRIWKAFNLARLYDYEQHVRIGEALEAVGRLPPDFMLLPPHSWHPDVWTDVAQMRSLNTVQAAKGAEKHLCPLPFDIVKRCIVQRSMPGETVLDPFGGLMTVPYVAVELGRRGAGIELNPSYFLDGAKHVEAMARKVSMPSLFDYLGERGGGEGEAGGAKAEGVAA